MALRRSFGSPGPTMFAEYLARVLPLNILGYFERISVSAKHYALRLLNNKQRKFKNAAEKIAEQLVYGYKDHGFVICAAECLEIFGDQVIKMKTKEYIVGNTVHVFLDTVNMIYRWHKKKIFSVIGSVENLDLWDIPADK